MTMNVKGTSQHNPAIISEQQRSQIQARQNQGQQQGQTPSVAATGADTVSFTDTATRLKALEQQLANQPVVDKNRVDAIKRDIASGTFRVDANRVAEKMLNLEGMIGGPAKE